MSAVTPYSPSQALLCKHLEEFMPEGNPLKELADQSKIIGEKCLQIKQKKGPLTNEERYALKIFDHMNKDMEKGLQKIFRQAEQVQASVKLLLMSCNDENKASNRSPEEEQAYREVAVVATSISKKFTTTRKVFDEVGYFKSKCEQVNLVLRVSEKLGMPPYAVTDYHVQEFYKVEKADRAFAELVASEEKISKDKAPSCRKLKNLSKGKSKSKQKQVSLHLPSNIGIEHVQPSVQETIKTPEMLRHALCQEWMDAATPTFHGRVKRWRTADLGKIKLFKDRDLDGKTILRYADYTPEELMKMKEYHDLPGTHKFMNKIFSIPTSTGVSILCCLKRKGHPAVFGVLKIGIAQGQIYHLFLEELDPSRIEQLDVFKSAFVHSTTDAVDCGGNSEDEHEGSYSATVSKEGVVTILYPERESSIDLFPVRKDLLPAYFSAD